MRLWHKDLIPYLPQKQLVAQWRELCCIAKNIANKGTPNHLLVNKILDYPIGHFWFYTNCVIFEMKERGYNVDVEKFLKWYRQIGEAFPDFDTCPEDEIYPEWHNDRYLFQCYYNLQEKYDCGGLTDDEWNEIEEYVLVQLKFSKLLKLKKYQRCLKMEKVKLDYETCMNCIYHSYHSVSFCLCSYILVEKHSRIYDEGKRMVEKGYCDKFISMENKDELKRVKEIKIKNNV